MLRRLLPLITFLAIFLNGCGEQSASVGGTPRAKVFHTAVSLSPSATEIVGQKTAQILIVGRTAQCNYPFPNMTQPVVMNGVKPNYEKIAELKPDLIVYDADLFSADDVKKLGELGADLYAFKGSTIDEYADCLYRFGAFAGGETDISEYVNSMLAAKELGEHSPLSPKPKVAIMLPGSGSDHMIAGLGSLQADVVRASGAEPVGPDAKMFVPANAEWLVSANPDAILIAGDELTIENDPRFKTVAAIKNGRTAHLNPDIALRRGARVDKFITQIRDYLIKTQPGAGK